MITTTITQSMKTPHKYEPDICCSCQAELDTGECYICQQCNDEIDRRADETLGNSENEND
ncbi:Uncharacterised protein [Serratia ficaria]|nr:Uncharacterised protein [Serratia ficaria]CAI1769591.1 Uncharacterised protein [Serratia ficaria]CAI2464773.1 Uncharacterised protein [Serratia ficaria]